MFSRLTAKIGVILLMVLSNPQLYAQENNTSFTVGIDPLVVSVLGGFEIEAGYNWGKNRIAVEFLGAELPSAWNSQIGDGEEVSTAIYEIGYSRFLKDGHSGFHYGLAFSLFSNYEVEDASGQVLDKDITKLGVRLGYIWHPFKDSGFFVEPLFNLGIYLNDEDLDFGNNVVFDEAVFAGSGPVLHLGWRFNTK